jgi:hypothetical protein
MYSMIAIDACLKPHSLVVDFLKLPSDTLAGFDLTTHSSNLLFIRRRLDH